MNNLKTTNSTIAKNTLYLYIRMLIIMFVNLFVSRIVLDKLGIVDYGIYNVVGSLVLLFSFIQGSLASSSSRFFAYEIGSGTLQTLNNNFCMSLNIHLLFSLFILLFSETLGLWYFYNKMVIPVDRQTAAFIVYQLSCLTAIFNILIVPYRSLIIAKEHMKAFAYISILEAFLKLSIAFCLSYERWDRLVLYGVLLFIMNISIMILYFRYSLLNFKESKFKLYWNNDIFKDMFAFSGWSICSYISTGVVSQAYNLMLNLFFGPVVNTARAISYQVQSAVYNFVINFQIAINPQIIKCYAATEIYRVYELVIMSSKISFSLLFIIFFPLLLNIDDILLFWLTEVPDYTNNFIILIAFSSMLMTFANPLSVVAEAANKLKLYNLITMPIYIISVISSYLMLKNESSVYTVFYMTIFIEFFIYFVKLQIVNKISGIPVKGLVFLFLKGTLSILLLLIVINNNSNNNIEFSFMEFIVRTIIGLIIAIFWIYLIILSNNEKKIVAKKIWILYKQ